MLKDGDASLSVDEQRHRNAELQALLPKDKILAKPSRENVLGYLQGMLPILEWLPRYRWKEQFKDDLLSGLSVAVIMMPQGMAYAAIAGLGPVYGLYCSWLPPLLYGIFGTSRELSVGPVAILSLLVGTGVHGVIDPHHDNSGYINLCLALSFVVGMIQLLMGLFRLGFLVEFLSNPVSSGVISAAAIIIISSQLKNLLGVWVPKSELVYEILYHIGEKIQETHIPTLCLSLSSIMLLLFMKHLSKVYRRNLPGVILVVFLGIGFGTIFHVDDEGLKIIGEVPGGLPEPNANHVNSLEIAFKQLGPMAGAIAVVGFVEAIAIGKKFADLKNYEIRANQELIALGLCNLIGSMFGAYPVTCSMERTAINYSAGCESPMSSIVVSVIVTVTLLFLTPVFHYLPRAVLAAIIVVTVFGLLEGEELKYLWRVKRQDAWVALISFVVTLVFGIEVGVVVSVVVSLVFVIRRSSRPGMSILGRISGTQAYRSIERFTDAKTFSGILVFRFDAPIFFANAGYFKEVLQSMEHSLSKTDHPLWAVVIDASSINDVDSSGLHVLEKLVEEYQRKGVKFCFACLTFPVRKIFQEANFFKRIGSNRVFLEVHDAVEFLNIKQGSHVYQVESYHSIPSPTGGFKPSFGKDSPQPVHRGLTTTMDGTTILEGSSESDNEPI